MKTRKLAAAAALSLFAAGLAVPAQANASDGWSSIFVEHNGVGWGAADNYPSKAEAQNAALNQCQSTGAARCVHIATGQGCVSAARYDGGWSGGTGPNIGTAEAAALSRNGGTIVVTRC